MRAGGGVPKTAALLLVPALLLGACSGGDDTPEPTTTTTVVVPDQIVEGGTARLGVAGPLAVDPATASLASPSDLLVLDLLYDGLARVDADGSAEPALASTWRADETLTAWEFDLDPEARFASGRPVTAADVIASLERVAKGGDSSLAALRLEPIVGFRAFVDGTAAHLAGLSAPAEGTVHLQLTTPLSVLPIVLSSPVFGIVDVESLDRAVDVDADLAGLDLSGGWAVAEADGDELRLERRDGADGHLDAVRLLAFDDADAAFEGFEEGQVDWALTPTERYREAVDEHGGDHVVPFHAELFFGLNVASPTLANVGLRRAIQAAIDRDAVVEEVYADRADPLATVVPAGVAGHDPDVCDACGHDPARAEQLLAEAFPDGAVPTVHVDFDTSSSQTAMAELVAEQLEAVGIPTELRPQSLEEYKQFVVSGGQELFSFGWIGGYASPDAYLAPLFTSGSDDNLTGYRSATVDAALGTARRSSDPGAAHAQWNAAEAQVLAEAVVVPIAQFRIQAVVGGRLQGFQAAVDGSVDWSAVWVVDGD